MSFTDAQRDPSPADIRRWQQYLADERAEASVYRDLATRRTGEERAILLALAEAEGRHEQHWRSLLGDRVGRPRKVDLRTRILGTFARRFGSVFVLALAQRAESRSPYESDADATAAMAADEHVHEEVVRGLAARGRNRLSGSFRAAVFGANDGLVSNLALVAGVAASGIPPSAVLVTGVAGLLAGALSMGAGEFVSVRSQRELLEASSPGLRTGSTLPDLDVDANELALIYRARGMDAEAAAARAARMLADHQQAGATPRATDDSAPMDLNGGDRASGVEYAGVAPVGGDADEHEAIGTAVGAAGTSFCFFACGALIPILPWLFGMGGPPALLLAAVLVGLALLGTGATVGLLSGGPPLARALRQLVIGYAAAAVTYLLGLAFGAAGI